jgi:hypothetical protein
VSLFDRAARLWFAVSVAMLWCFDTAKTQYTAARIIATVVADLPDVCDQCGHRIDQRSQTRMTHHSTPRHLVKGTTAAVGQGEVPQRT